MRVYLQRMSLYSIKCASSNYRTTSPTLTLPIWCTSSIFWAHWIITRRVVVQPTGESQSNSENPLDCLSLV